MMKLKIDSKLYTSSNKNAKISMRKSKMRSESLSLNTKINTRRSMLKENELSTIKILSHKSL